MPRTCLVLIIVTPLSCSPARSSRPRGVPPRRQLTGCVFDARDGATLPHTRILVSAGDRALAPVPADDRGRVAVDVPESSGAAAHAAGRRARLDASDVVEHPELVRQRLDRFIRLVGRDRVIA